MRKVVEKIRLRFLRYMGHENRADVESSIGDRRLAYSRIFAK